VKRALGALAALLAVGALLAGCSSEPRHGATGPRGEPGEEVSAPAVDTQKRAAEAARRLEAAYAQYEDSGDESLAAASVDLG
jgi:predicted small lipoprotein YifL